MFAVRGDTAADGVSEDRFWVGDGVIKRLVGFERDFFEGFKLLGLNGWKPALGLEIGGKRFGESYPEDGKAENCRNHYDILALVNWIRGQVV